MHVFNKIPFLRILIPFVLGILFTAFFKWTGVDLIFLSVTLAFCCFFIFFLKHRITKFFLLFFVDVFLFLIAVNLANACDITKQANWYGNKVKVDTANKVIVVVEDVPVETEKFFKCNLKVLKVKLDTGYSAVSGKMIGYFRKSAASQSIKGGHVIFFNANLIAIEPPKNPFEFDYRNYLSNKQIHHISFIDSSSFHIVDSSVGLSPVWLFGLKVKQYILSALKNSDLSPEAYSICAALLTGYDHDINSDVMEAFSHSGTLHVLSVSGLHTGLIYLVLAFLFDKIDTKRKYKLIKFVFITISLWSFALITGFSAPVLRAVIMFNLLGIGKIFFRNDYRNQINILFVSAFILLSFDTFLIYDIGFLLSYFAMFGIIFFQPIFSNLWHPEKRWSQYIWQSFSASFAATLTTLPLTLFYFKQFPLWFFICNLIVVPATFLVLLLAVFVVFKLSFVSVVVNYLITALINFIGLFNVSGTGYIDNIHFDWLDSILLSILIILISSAFYYRSFIYSSYTLIVIIFWQCNSLISSYNEKQKSILTIYQIKKNSVSSIKNKTNVMCDSISTSDYNYHVKPNLTSYNYPLVSQAKHNLVKSSKETVLFLNRKNFWPDTDLASVTMLVISNNFKLSERDVEQFSGLKTIVADGSNNRYVIKKLAELSSKFGFQFHSTSEKGAYVQKL